MNNWYNIYKHLALVLLGSSCLCFTVPAQDDYLYNTKRLTVRNGLAHQEVYDIFQDTKGFIWMGTRSGLDRYNGYTFDVFTKEKNGLSNNSIHAIKQDSAGNLWLFSQVNASRKSKLQSVDLFDMVTGHSKSFANAFPQAPFAIADVEHFFFSQQGYFFYAKKTLWKYTAGGNSFSKVSLPPNFSPEGCSAADAIWGTSGNLYQKLDAKGKVAVSIQVDSIEQTRPVYLGEDEIYLLIAEKRIKRFAATAQDRPLLARSFEGTNVLAIRHLDASGEPWGKKDFY
jgi:Two component regulator propeller